MASKPPTAIQTASGFIRAHLGRSPFAPHTGQDMSAWCAFVYLVECWCRGDASARPYLIAAMRNVLACAQRNEGIQITFALAIPAIGDWAFINQIWPYLDGIETVGTWANACERNDQLRHPGGGAHA